MITVYRPHVRHELGFFSTWKIMVRNIYQARELIWQLFKRDFLGSYKKSFIGLAWIIISPLVGILSWVFLQKTGMLRPGESGIPYPAYVLIGTSMWGLFMGFFNAAAIGLVVSMVSVLSLDVDKVVQVILSLTLWITPIIYTDNAGSTLVRTLNAWNPLTYLVCSARDIVIHGSLYHPGGYFFCAVLSFLLFMISWRLFYVSENTIIERMI